jgi:hypothetical protein
MNSARKAHNALSENDKVEVPGEKMEPGELRQWGISEDIRVALFWSLTNTGRSSFNGRGCLSAGHPLGDRKKFGIDSGKVT